MACICRKVKGSAISNAILRIINRKPIISDHIMHGCVLIHIAVIQIYVTFPPVF